MAKGVLWSLPADCILGGWLMKTPLFTAITGFGFEWQNLEAEADMHRTDIGPKGWLWAWQAVLAKYCALPRIACRVEESVPFRLLNGDSGWFVIRSRSRCTVSRARARSTFF